MAEPRREAPRVERNEEVDEEKENRERTRPSHSAPQRAPKKDDERPTTTMNRGTLLADGRYRIRKELNRGGTAVVYEADDLQAGSKVALKVMNTRDGVMTMPIKQVKREVEIASSMRHPNIVQLIDVFAEGTQLVIVWELVSGPDLLDLLNACNGRMTEKQAAHYFKQIHMGVTFLHENGLCHR